MTPAFKRVALEIHRYAFSSFNYKLTAHFKNVCFNRCLSLNSRNFYPRKYSEKHEWVSTEENVGTIGITNYAQEALGEVVYVQLPELGQEYKKDSEIGVVESVKAVNEIYTPVSGKAIEINEELSDRPAAINESCYEKGWICKLELLDPKELDGLMDEQQYETYLKSIEK